ncbi:MAG: 50S ribosomal protein L3 [Candidatus Pacearchaeota archaeon]
MTDNNRIRKGSLQFYPRVRAKKVIPSANWRSIKRKEAGLLGFIGYKVGMVSAWVKDSTDDSLTKNKKIIVPATILECPAMKIYSVRFYKNGKTKSDVVVSKDKELKGRIKVSKDIKQLGDEKDFDDIRVIIYSGVKSTSVDKKTPDMMEIALSGSKEEKINFIKEKIGKEISIKDVFKGGLVDVRSVSKGYGTQGPVKRFGISLKNHKTEKGLRRPGSLGPWHPARVTFRTSQAGQTGFHSRVSYNHLILEAGKISEKNINVSGGFKHYGNIKTDYIILNGSIAGPHKRGILITSAMRPTKKQSKKKYEVLELR